MAGIIGFGSYVPRYRLPREVIAREWGHASLGGEKAVANHDEDSLTLAINAAPTPRALPALAKALGLDAKKQLPDSLWTLIGDTGTTQPSLLLAGALERAQSGDLILLVSYL